MGTGYRPDRLKIYEGDEFELHHQSLAGTYRWKAHLFRHRLVRHLGANKIYGIHEQLVPDLHLRNSKLVSSTFDERRMEFIKEMELPSTATPTLYVEVHGVFPTNYNLRTPSGYIPKSQWNNNWQKNSKYGHVKDTTVQQGLLSNPLNAVGPSLDAILKPFGGWSKWWSKKSIAGSDVDNDVELRIDVGQASGAHTYGWLARGGKGLWTKGSDKIDLHCPDILPTFPPTGPPIFEGLRFNRAGFILFELQRKDADGVFRSVSQDGIWGPNPNCAINPLSLPIVLDYAEKFLVNYCIENAHFKKTKPTGNAQSYPLRTWAGNSHHLSQTFDKSSLIHSDLSKVRIGLEEFVTKKHHLFEKIIPEMGPASEIKGTTPEYGNCLAGTVW